jgi:hypothetical protein
MKLDDATVDRLRELGATDDMLTWLREPEAVRMLLRHDPTSHADCHQCAECGQHRWEGHLRECGVFAAWWALRHPWAFAAINAAHAEALEALFSDNVR